MRNKFNIILYIMLSCAGSYAGVTPGAGTFGGQALSLVENTKYSGMGGVSAGEYKSQFSLMNNPGGLPFLAGYGFSMSHTEYFTGMRFEKLAGYANLTEDLTIGGEAAYLDFGKITEIVEDYSNPASPTYGKYSEKGSFNPNALIFGFGAGYSLGVNFGLGLNITGISETLYDSAVTAFGLKLGGLYDFDGFRLGFSAANIGGKEKFAREAAWPLEARLGAGFDISKKINIAADAIYSAEQGIGLNAGFQAELIDRLSLRAGYRYRGYNSFSGGLSGLTAGFGLDLGKIQLDYSYNTPAENLIVHRLELSFRFMPSEGKKPAAVKKKKGVEFVRAEAPPQQTKKIKGNPKPVQVSAPPSEKASSPSTGEERGEGEAKLPEKTAMSQEEKAALKKKYFFKGSECMKAGDYGRAVEAFEKVLEVDPGHELSRQKLERARELYSQNKN